MIFVPVGDGLKPVYTQSVAIKEGIDYTSELTYDHVEFSLTSPRCADEFRDLAKKMVASSIGGIGSAGFAFVMDTSEADNMLRTIRMLDNLYPIAFAVAAIMGGFFPGLIVMQSDREASIMRVLGTTKKRTRLMLTLEQTVLCLAGFVCGVFVLLMINGVLPAAVTSQLGVYTALHFAMCVAGALVCAVIVTRRRILELLQVKE
jgi:ABC-type antimicrobial peptide transport system permease subunit